MQNEGYRNGLVDPRQRARAIDEATELLERLAAHRLWAELQAADVAQHEIPFTTQDSQGQVQSGQIDLLWRNAEGWQIVDFKTDALRHEAGPIPVPQEYREQVERYVRSAANILGERPRGRLCFLDSKGAVELVDV